MGPVVVTGATGNVGRAVAVALETIGIRTRVAGRRPAVLRREFPNAEAAHLDFLDPSTFDALLSGAASLFLIRPPAIARVGPTLNVLIDRAACAGVRHIVYSSVAGAERNRFVPHHRVEAHLRATAVGWTILRPGFFAQNLGGAYRRDIREDDRLYLPAGTARVAFVDTRDIGEAAARILADPSAHFGRGYHLTGHESPTFEQVARLLTEALDRTIRYRAASALGYAFHLLRRRRLGVAQTVVQTLLHLAVRHGDAEAVDPTLGVLLARPPRTVGQYIRDHVALWQR